MKKRIVAFVLVGLSLLCFSDAALAQASRLVSRGDQFFRIRNYDAALELYQQALEEGAEDPEFYYHLGVCYAEQSDINLQTQGIQYLEDARDAEGAKIPDDVYYYLGKLYHLDTQIGDAVKAFNQFKQTNPTGEVLQEVERMLEICHNAGLILNNAKEIEVYRFGDNINTRYTEYNPVVSADESVMAFTALRSPSGRGDDLIEEIHIAYQTDGVWQNPTKLELNTNANVGTAGISPDGQQMLIFIGGRTPNTGGIYTIQKTGSTWGTPQTIGRTINSNYLSTTASLTPDDKKIYFASNRPGGMGGLDIWMAEKQPDGSWGTPKNLGPEVNTAYDEDAPFIHPDQRTLFFTSNGHNTIGGNDIFKTYLIGNEWTTPENMGYPINTTADDNYFTLTADGRKGYFSSDRKGGSGGQDIYFLDMPESEANIAVTMVKGRILTEDGTTVPTKINVIDNETSEKVEYVYDPDPETGNYLIIFPPGKSYDMIIMAEGYLPYTVNINIPNQKYFYQLYQQIILRPVRQFDEVVGQGVEVKNAFYDSENTNPNDPRQTRERLLVQNDSVDLYEMMDLIVAGSDDVAYDYLLDLIYENNPIDSVEFDEVENENIEAAQTVYYYEENPNEALEMRIIDGDTIYTLPTFFVTQEAEKQKQARLEAPSGPAYDKALLNEVVKVYFGVGASELQTSYHAQLDNLLRKVQNIEELGLEISGYASSEGDPEFNRKLSNQRAIAVLDYLNDRGLPRRKVVARGFGATQNEGGSPEESRRVEIKIVDISGR